MSRLSAWLAWLAAATAAGACLAALVAGPGYRLGLWGLGGGFQTVRWGAIAALAGAAVGLLAMLVAWRHRSRRHALVGLLAVLLGLAVAAPPIYLYRRAADLPKIHDISTDTVDPPSFVAVLPWRLGASNPTDYSTAVASEQLRAYADIAPAVLPAPPSEALRLAEQVARGMGWEIIDVDRASLRMEATATTLLFGFRDDVVVRVRPQGNGSRVDVRSLSRIGKSDLGTNADRVRTFVRKLESASQGAG